MNNSPGLKRIFHITTPDSHDTPRQVLSVRVGEKHFAFSVNRVNSDELLQVTWYTAEEVDENVLREIYLAESSLHQPFYRAVICYDYPEAVLLPEKYYRSENAKDMLDLMHGVNGGNAIVAEPIPSKQMRSVYAIPAAVQSWIKGHFPAAVHHHNYTVGIKQVSELDFDGSLLVDFRTDDFSLVVSKGNDLLLAQTYCYSIPADVLYYLLKACKEFSFSQEKVRLTVSGLIEKQSTLYKELYQYFLNLRFREADWRVPGTESQEYPAHFFTSFNDVAVCAL